MAIQTRRGDYADYDASKMLPAEFATMLQNDPRALDGKALHIAYAPGVDKTLMTFEDAEAMIEDAAEEAASEAVSTATATATAAATTATNQATLSQSYAKGGTGTRTGEDTDNAKYYMEQAAEIVGFTPESTYPFLTAGQLLSTHETTDNTPYNYRVVEQESTLEYGDIIGGTVAFNQLMQNGDFSSATGWAGQNASLSVTDNVGTLTVTTVNNDVSLRRASVNALANHVFITSAMLSPSKAGSAMFYLNGAITIGSPIALTANAWNRVANIVKPTESTGGFNVYCNRNNALAVGDTCKYKNVMLIDLTQLLGTTIADHIYSLESATAGAGVAWLRTHFPKMFAYHAYDAGSLVSVEGLSHHVTVGFNQWDEQWEVGHYNNTNGEKISNPNKIRSKNPIRVFPNTEYYFNKGNTNGLNVYVYDSNMNYVSWGEITTNSTYTFSDNIYYLNFSTFGTNTTTYNHDICINIFDSAKNGTYEPYTPHTYPLDSTKTFRGIFKLDSNNRLYADGDVYNPDGTVVRRYGIVDLGTLNWSYSDADQRFYTTGIDSAGQTSTNPINCICPIYEPTWYDSNKGTSGKNMRIGGVKVNSTTYVNITNSSYTTAAAFKTAMSGVYLVYELATPTTETADPYTNPQIIAPGGTEEYISTSVVPVGHESSYPLDIAGSLDKILDTPTADGTYTLRATVSGGKVTYSWVSGGNSLMSMRPMQTPIDEPEDEVEEEPVEEEPIEEVEEEPVEE